MRQTKANSFSLDAIATVGSTGFELGQKTAFF